MATDEENIAFARAAICGGSTGYPSTYHDYLVELCIDLRSRLAERKIVVPSADQNEPGPYWAIEKPSDDVAQQVSSRFPAFGTNLNVRELIEYAQSLTDALAPAPTAPPELPIWAGNFSKQGDSNSYGFGRVQREFGGGSISTSTTAIAGDTVPELGVCIRHRMDKNQKRLEAAPGSGGSGFTEGLDRYFRFDFSLGDDFPITQTDPFCCINQIHQGSGSGSPPIEFDIHSGALHVRGSYNADGKGNRTTYTRKLVDVRRRTKYTVVYRVKFSETASKCLLEVWVNGTKLLTNFVPPTPNMWGGSSYWKGSTMYCRESIPPLTCYQAGHRVGRSYASVA